MAQQLALAPLAGDPGSVPSTHVSRVTTAGKSRESDSTSGLHEYLHTCGTHSDTQTHIDIHIHNSC